MNRVIALFLFSLFFSFTVFAEISSYSGGVKTFALSDNHLALHEHGTSFENDDFTVYSRISIFKKVKDSFVKSVTSNTPELISISWTNGEDYLVGLTNLYGVKADHIYIYDSNLNLLKSASWECSPKSYNPLFCNSRSSPEQKWLSKMLDRVTLKIVDDTLRVCIDGFCKEVTINPK